MIFMEANMTPIPPTLLDLTGLPEPVIRQIQDLVDSARVQVQTSSSVVRRKPILGRLAHLKLNVPTLDDFQAEHYPGAAPTGPIGSEAASQSTGDLGSPTPTA
jgi:hypothetical protein